MDPMQIEPAVARGTFKEEHWLDDYWVAQEKLDGVRYLQHIHKDHIHLTSRRKSVNGNFVEKANNFPQLADVNYQLEGTILDGELIMKASGISYDTTQVTGGLPEYAIDLQKRIGWAKHYVFDILFFKGKDIRSLALMNRMEILKMAVKELENEHTILVPLYNPKYDKRVLYDNIVARGGEGLILKHISGEYGDKKSWIKIKQEKTYDVIIHGCLDPIKESKKVSGEVSTTKYYKKGWIGAFLIGQYVGNNLVNFGSVSGFDEAVRSDASANMNKYMGRVIEIKAQQRLPSGMFRHARFSRFRDDKSPTDCKYDKNEG